MSCQPFTLTVANIPAVLAELQRHAEFTASRAGGDFVARVGLGTVKGSLVIRDNEIEVTIISKPRWLSCEDIEQHLRSEIANQIT